MNICFYCDYDGGGTERATVNLVRYLKTEFNIFLLSSSLKEPSFLLDDIDLDHLEYHTILQQIFSLRRYLKKNKIDVLISLEALSGITAIPAAKLAHCKLIIWEHANYYQNQGSRYTHLMRWIEMIVSDAYVVLTKRDYKNFKTHFTFIRTKLTQIYNVAGLIQRYTYDINSKTIISAGHISKIKNYSIIPEIARKVFEKHSDWRWKIYGYSGDDYELLLNNIKKYGLENHVLVCGRCIDMDAAYQEASLYVMTSLQEGFPMVLLEAQAHRLPIISFNIETGPDEIVHDGVNGFLIENRDVDAMTTKILELVEDAEKRHSFSDNTLIDADNFSGEVIAEQWKDILKSVCER